MRPHLAFVLKAKHWQLFSLFMGATLIFEAWMVASTPTTASPEGYQGFFSSLMVLTALFMGGFIAWLWVLGCFFWSLVPPELRLSMRTFKLSLIYPLAYTILFGMAMLRMPAQPPTWIVPLHLLAMFCVFYNLHFVAKSLRLAELRKPVGFYDYSGPFVLLWFFPIGIWVIQPVINRLYALHGNVDV